MVQAVLHVPRNGFAQFFFTGFLPQFTHRFKEHHLAILQVHHIGGYFFQVAEYVRGY